MRKDRSSAPVGPLTPPENHSELVQEYRAFAQACLADTPHADYHQLDKEIAWNMAHYGGYTSAAIRQAMQEAQTPPQHPLRPCIIKLIPSPRAWPPLQQCSLFSSNFLDNTGGP
ncbi:MAG: hypothetical protein AB7N91_32820, partial [Candidatus Tectimicrobiota bacterium]